MKRTRLPFPNLDNLKCRGERGFAFERSASSVRVCKAAVYQNQKMLFAAFYSRGFGSQFTEDVAHTEVSTA